jgi:hypothetical protein
LQKYISAGQETMSMQFPGKRNHGQSACYFLSDLITIESIDLTLSIKNIYNRIKNDETAEFKQLAL